MLHATWCCVKSGAITYDLPPPLAGARLSSASEGAGCTPQAHASYPSVAAAVAAQNECAADPACFSNCRNRLSKRGRVACRDLNVTMNR